MAGDGIAGAAAADSTAAVLAAERPRDAALPLWKTGIVAGLLWIGAGAVTWLWPDDPDLDLIRTGLFAWLQAIVGAAILVSVVTERAWPSLTAWIRPRGPWLLVLPVLLVVWQIVTAKTLTLPRPFFVAPQALVEVYTDDYARLGESVFRSFILLAYGYAIGAVIGFVTGVSIGWSRNAGYWVHPVLRLIGPLPATAWLPIAFFAFPTSFSASVFLVALATAFPVTVLTWSGVASVNPAYYDVARTLGAKAWFLVLRVSIPAALPHLFVGLFMGLGASFSVLVVAEMMGVKAGLGWYLQWAQGWAAYANVYAALAIMAIGCSSLITLLFKVRDHLLAWQKGMVKW